jgi:hypothetical protein
MAGVGFGPRHVALAGFVDVGVTETPTTRPGRSVGHGGRQIPDERRDVRRQNEAILLVLLS